MSNAVTNPTNRPAKPPIWLRVLDRYRQRPLLYGFGTLLLGTVLMIWLSSLSSTAGPETRGGLRDKGARDNHIRFVVETLNRLEDYDAWRYTEMLRDNLNQWIGQLELSGVWPVDPYVPNRIPLRIQQAWGFDTAKRQRLTFTLEDARWIQGAVWMRDISRGVRRRIAAAQGGGVVEPLSLAQGLLDWTIRNIALQEGDAPVPELAWETVLWGRGSANSRAWVFMELCRQQRLEVAMLAYRDPKKSGTDKVPSYRSWILAVLIPEGKQSTFYLFDHMLGIPVPGPGGNGVATLKQAIEQPEVLRQLDVGVRKYLVEPAHLKGGLMAGIHPSPFLLSRRMQLLQSELQGRNEVILTGYLSDVAARFDKALRQATGADESDKSFGTQIWGWPGLCLEHYRFQQAQQRNAPQPQGGGHQLFDQRLFPFGLSGFERKGDKDKKLERDRMKSFQVFLFSVPAGPQRELSAGRISDSLRKAFADNNTPLPARVSISVVDAGREWQINADGRWYVVRKAGQSLNVYFQAPTPGQLPQELQQGAMLASMQQRQGQKPVPGFLWQGRMLQFKGIYADVRGGSAGAASRLRGAPNVLQSGRLSEIELDQMKADLEADLKKLQDAAQEAIKQGQPNDFARSLQMGAAGIHDEIVRFPAYRFQRQFVRMFASYWLGVISYERGDYDEADQYFRHFRDTELKILQETVKLEREETAKRIKDPEQRREGMFESWSKVFAAGMRYNLARSLEAAGKLSEAIALYEQDNSPDSRHGSLLRARRLREQLQKKNEKEKQTTKKVTEKKE